MSNTEFHQTPMGRDFFDRTMPKLANALEKLADHSASMREALEFTLPFIARELHRHNDLLERLTDVFEEKYDTSNGIYPRLPWRPDFDIAHEDYRKQRDNEQ